MPSWCVRGQIFAFILLFADESTNIRWKKITIIIRSHFEFMPCLTMSDCIFCLWSNFKIYHKKDTLETRFFLTFPIRFALHLTVPAFELLIYSSALKIYTALLMVKFLKRGTPFFTLYLILFFYTLSSFFCDFNVYFSVRKWATGLLYTKTKALFIYLRDISFIFRDKIVKSFFFLWKKGWKKFQWIRKNERGRKG